MKIPRRQYADLYGPTTGDRIRLADTDLIIEITRDLTVPGELPPHFSLPYHESIEAHSRYIIERAIEEAGGNQSKAADRLKLQRTYLARLLKQQKEKVEPE